MQQGEPRDEDTLGLAGLQGLPHPHHDQVILEQFDRLIPTSNQDGFINIQLEMPGGERAEDVEGASVHHR